MEAELLLAHLLVVIYLIFNSQKEDKTWSELRTSFSTNSAADIISNLAPKLEIGAIIANSNFFFLEGGGIKIFEAMLMKKSSFDDLSLIWRSSSKLTRLTKTEKNLR